MRALASWAVAVVSLFGVWCLVNPNHFVATITLHRAKPTRLASYALRLAGLLAVVGGLLELADYLRAPH
jgi:hypothetical protein